MPRFLVVGLCLLFAGCGFKLQGRGELPAELRVVALEYKASYQVLEPPLLRALQAQVERRGGQIGDIGSRLQIAKLEESQQILSVGGDGKALEYLLTTTASFSLFEGGEIRVPPQTLSVNREYNFKAGELLGSEAESLQLREQMQQELADLILIRIESLLKNG